MFTYFLVFCFRTAFLDQEWFSFESSNTLIVGWNGGPSRARTVDVDTQRTTMSQLKEQVISSGIEIAAAAATGKPPPPLFPLVDDSQNDDSPRTYRSDNDKKQKQTSPRTRKGQDAMLSLDEGIDLLNRTFTYLRRAVVLAHRGRHWLLLQNACRAMWNTAHAALTRAISPLRNGAPFMTVELVRKIIWYSFFTAADCILDMLVQMQLEQDRVAKHAKGNDLLSQQVRSWLGDASDERGGASLRFDEPTDDEILYFEARWERLVDIALRFNALTGLTVESNIFMK